MVSVLGLQRGPKGVSSTLTPTARTAQPLPGDGPVLDVLLEATLVGEDLVADVAALLLPGKQEPEEAAIDPAHEAWQEGAGGTTQRGNEQSYYWDAWVAQR